VNYTTLVGNLAADAEMRYLADGKPVLEFRFAVNEPKRKDGAQEDAPTYWRVSLWREDAEAYADLLRKGTRVVVVGRPRVREFERSDGSKGMSPEITGFPVVGIVPPRERVQSAPSSAAAEDPWATAGQPAEEPGW